MHLSTTTAVLCIVTFAFVLTHRRHAWRAIKSLVRRLVLKMLEAFSAAVAVAVAGAVGIIDVTADRVIWLMRLVVALPSLFQ